MKTALTTVAPMVGKLLRLLGSDKDGEIVASVHALRRVLAAAGLTLHDLAGAIELPPEPVEGSHQQSDVADAWRIMARTCAQHAYALSDRERTFVLTMTRWCGRPSRKQLDWLVSISERVRRETAA